ncbi:hypothetical protein [Actinophytocola oryzae]|uniref:hypothetical protein n=1 Tax=Actinophytocola oryzae TaxID=502181 RepID=UPI001414EF7A|nr:hypothetical protein [Actinophytocola oryzae]
MEELSYIEAWRTWWTGANVNKFELWGLPVPVWARVGKVLQFMAGLAIVLDLIGPEN